MSSSNSRPVSVSGSRPPSITRSFRDTFSPSFETLPPEKIVQKEIREELPDLDLDKSNEEGNDNGKEVLGTSKDDCVVEEDEPANEYERKVRKGLDKIKRLDEVLSQKMAQEKELKRERRAFEKDFQYQVQSFIENKGTEKMSNTVQLLTLLSLNSDHPSEKIDDNSNSIFSTQIDPEFYKNSADEKTFKKKILQETPPKKSPEQKNKAKSNFIKRNIELANQASEAVQLTDDEKKRLEELLSDDNDLLLVENPFSERSLTNNNAYILSEMDSKALSDINEKLKDFVTDEELEILNKVNDKFSFIENGEDEGKEKKKKKRMDSLKEKLDKKSVKNKVNDSDELIQVKLSVEAFDTIENEIDCGEEVLQEKKIQRSLQQRLKEIERQLKVLQLGENEKGGIDPDLLRKLLESDSRLTSSSVSICESVFSNAEMMLTDNSLEESHLGKSWSSIKEVAVKE